LQDALEVTPGTEITVDLVAREVRAAAPGGPVELSAPFDIDDYTRWRLMEGLDDISLTLRYADEISSFEEHRPDWLPTADAVA
jgi:3-isopropylmalate/(R)-2-methylmalate dehydratase small subunit